MTWRDMLGRAARASPWTYLGLLVAPFVFLGILCVAWPRLFWQRFADPYLWAPISRDLGYNAVNTAVLVYLAVVGLAWFFSLFRAYRQRPDLRVTAAALVFYAWGSMLRILEDADFFAPFSSAQRAAGLDPTDPCSMGLPGTFLDRCAGAFFITPLLWIWTAFLMFGIARLCLVAERLSRRAGIREGVRFYALATLLPVLAHLIVDRLDPTFLRFVPHPASSVAGWAAANVLVAWRARREAALSWKWGLCGFGLVFLSPVALAILQAALPGRPGWTDAPIGPGHPWILLALAAGPTLVALAVWKIARILSDRSGGHAARSVLWLAYVTLLAAFAVFATLVGLGVLVETTVTLRGVALSATGPVVVASTILLTRNVRRRLQPNPTVGLFAMPLVLLMTWAQLADAFMTSIALDVYGTGEKHFVPRTLIAAVADAGLPAPFSLFPATLVMVPYKLLFTFLVAWWTETRLRGQGESIDDTVWLAQMAVVAVGIGPALRDCLRMFIGV